MDAFQKLPVEIVLSIVHHTADFFGVYSLLQVSPCMRSVFEANHSRLLEDLLTTCPSTSYELHQLVRIAVLIRTPSFKPLNFDEFALASHASALTGLQSLSEASAYEMIKIAARIQHLACVCLSKMLQSFRDAQYDPVFPKLWETNGTDPFSWIEEFRVYRILWRLQIRSDLQLAAAAQDKSGEDWGGWGWPSTEIQKLATYFDMSHMQAQQTHGVADILRELGALFSHEQEVLGPSLRDDMSPDFQYPMPLIESLQISTPDKKPIWCPPALPEDTGVDKIWGRSTRSCRISKQGVFYKAIQRDFPFQPGVYVTGLDDLRPFYRTGVFIWDNWRMYSLRLISMKSGDDPRAPYGCNFELLLETPDGAWVDPALTGRGDLQKTWSALLQRSIGGSESIHRRI
ncbi:uncharacterized protein N7479_004333 [Penicillium vulpinum]|uniref:F-box domain-containing protein n=1 Tax=Penicillium vulpinum TaxID=29845 RepID=A0A1V6SDJ8_9EURO|nr:uncharacterized protein N7479_004333 [Penicillium vulpinum]KAJ5964457.1 hypothetical protein N7479_004333 [Penicillium vulpinum]OQE11829.1 hypothetical protein PENVUL_c002G09548 [Penicillium vulpinum]